MYSLIVTAKLNDVDPRAWLADVLRDYRIKLGLISFFNYHKPQPSPHFFSCDSKAVGLDAKSPRHLQREAGPTDRVIPRVT